MSRAKVPPIVRDYAKHVAKAKDGNARTATRLYHREQAGRCFECMTADAQRQALQLAGSIISTVGDLR